VSTCYTANATPPSLMRAALACAERGWHVFPCTPGAKPPALRDTDWRQISTTDPAQIERWWTARPYNIGIDCGKSGLVVIDLDVPGHGAPAPGGQPTGRDELARLAREHGETIPTTFAVATPSDGGMHLYYTATSTVIRNSASKLAPLVDIRATAGYVIAPDSRIGDTPYTIASTMPLAPFPKWLARRLQQPSRSETVESHATTDGRRPASYAEAALAYEAAAVATAKEGTRNDTLNRAAFNLGQLVASGLLTATTVTADLTKAALESGLRPSEISRTVRSGLIAGERTPRQLPSQPCPPDLQIPHQQDQKHVTPRP
jgi:hypothetical protein